MPYLERKRSTYEKLRARLKNERTSYETQWRDAGDFILPTRTQFTTSEHNRGDRRNQKIIDSTASFSARTLSSGMHSGMTSPARPWFGLATPDRDLLEYGPVKQWLHTVRQLILDVFRGTNLYQILPIVYGDAGVFATGAMAVLEDDEDVIRCYDLPIGTYYIANDAKRRVRVFVQETSLTVRQLIEQFGRYGANGQPDWSNISTHVRNLWDRGDYEAWIDVVQVVEPNPDWDPSKLLSRYKRFISCYYERACDEDKLLEEKGYDEFPILGFRWDLRGNDVYGSNSPGLLAIGDIKQLQLGEKKSFKAIEKMENPPMKAQPEMRNSKLSTLPGDISYVADRDGKGFQPVYQLQFPIDMLEAKQEAARNRIKRAFFEDLFLMLAYTDSQRGTQPVTAREVDERHEEKFLMLGPVLERSNQDLLGPLIDRTFAVLNRRGQLPPPPPELQGQPLRIEYESVMAQAQRRLGLSSLQEFAISAQNLAAIDPSTLDKWNRDEWIEEVGDALGVSPKLIVPEEQVQQIRTARAQAQKAQQQAELAAKVAPAVNQLANASATNPDLLSQIIASSRQAGAVPGEVAA
jgi:hypothetical protein